MRERREHAANKLMASSAGLAGSLKWRWSGPSTIEGSNIGVVLAAASERPGTVYVYGVLGQGARLAMHRSASPGLQCSLSSRPETLVRPTGIAMLFEGYARPDFYTQRYGVIHPEARALPNRTRYPATPVLSRFECRFPGMAARSWPPRAGETLTLQAWGSS